jgi:uncharacterized phage-associated protein
VKGGFLMCACAYKAIDVADYIVDYCNKSGKKISHLQLQKILYFCEAHYLIENKNLFKDDISKWRLGPVVESVYHEYKTFGSRNITYVPNRLVLENGKFKRVSFNPDVIKENDKEKINKIVNKYITFGPFELVDATHEHEPWKRDEPFINSGIDLIFDKEELKTFFQNNPDAFEVKQ